MEIIVNALPAVITSLIAISIVWKYGMKAMRLITEVKELLTAILIAFTADEDGQVRLTREELDTIIKEAKDIPAAIASVIKKNKPAG